MLQDNEEDIDHQSPQTDHAAHEADADSAVTNTLALCTLSRLNIGDLV